MATHTFTTPGNAPGVTARPRADLSRAHIEALVETLIAYLDELDGNPDSEPDPYDERDWDDEPETDHGALEDEPMFHGAWRPQQRRHPVHVLTAEEAVCAVLGAQA